VSPFLNLFGRRGEREGKDEAPEAIEQQEMIEGVEQLPETIVKEVMVPRTDTVFLPVDADPETAFSALIRSGHSRIPVYRDSIDDVVGILYAKDVLAALIRRQEIQIAGLLRKPYFVPETKRIDSLLREFKRRRVHIAVVLDEYGATSGIVCMEDIIEEIVGEIQDEYDDEVDGIVSVGPQIWRCDARVRLEDLAERLDLVLPVEDFDSLAGYVFDLFGRIPDEGESIATDNASFTVKKMEGHRILSVQVERLAAGNPETGEE
jgi:CBS domain containing-hemolysin-like protein